MISLADRGRCRAGVILRASLTKVACVFTKEAACTLGRVLRK